MPARSTAANKDAGRSGRRAGLDLDQIVDATLRLVDEAGIGSASMRAIANRLGVEAQSLYNYVDTRDQLFDCLVEQIVNELSADPEVHWAPGDPWRPYLAGLARGVRRYARRHPHAFPLVATRPSEAPWVNPPLRSLRWIEAMLANLQASGFTDDQVLFAYRSFNGFLLGFLLLETGAMTVEDSLPGDGSFASRGHGSATAGDSRAPVPGQVSPTRTVAQRTARDHAHSAEAKLDPADTIDAARYPVLHDLAAGLANEYYEDEFAAGLDNMLDRIGRYLSET